MVVYGVAMAMSIDMIVHGLQTVMSFNVTWTFKVTPHIYLFHNCRTLNASIYVLTMYAHVFFNVYFLELENMLYSPNL